MEHSKGPWRVRNHPGMGIWVDAPNAIVENNRGPSYARQILEDEEYPEKLADAELIAQAPDLLAERDRLRAVNAALVAALAECVTDNPGAACYNTGRKTRRLEAISDIARAAIAQAEQVQS